MVLGLIVLTMASPVIGQEQVACTLEYANQNMIDYGPLSFRSITGRAVDPFDVPVPQVCVAIFTDKGLADKDHRQVASVLTDESGYFHFLRLQPGQYRVVAKYDGFGVLNVKVNIVRWPRGGSGRRLALHMRPRAIDVTSYAGYK